MKKNLLGWKQGTFLRIFGFRGHSIKWFQSFSTRFLVTISLTVVDTFWPISTRSRWGTCTYMVHVPLQVSGLILHGAFQTKFLGNLYHKLSIFMLIRRGTGSFKCYFRIFGNLGNFFIMVWVPLWWELTGVSPIFLCYQLEFYQIILTGERSYQWLKDATLFALLSDKSTERFKSKYSNICQFSILAAWRTWSCDVTAYIMRAIAKTWRIDKIRIFPLEYLSAVIR